LQAAIAPIRREQEHLGKPRGYWSDSSAPAGAEQRDDQTMSKNIRSKAVSVGGLIAVCLLAAACNTVAGAGKDTAAAGHAVTNTAEQAKP
jgi:predicted small secreted protein